MAKFELYINDFFNEQKVSIEKTIIEENGKKDVIEMVFLQTGIGGEIIHSMYLDKSTAIKFAKTLRTEINKITESEVSNGGK